MNIYILEDQPYHQNRLRACLQGLSASLGIPMVFKQVTGHPEELLASITSVGRQEIYFLDIELHGEAKRGLEVAQEIRQKDDLATIIFVTTHAEFATITYSYKVAALDFIDKDQGTESFIRSLESSLRHIQKATIRSAQEDIFELKMPHRHIRLPFHEICYIETSQVPHKLILMSDFQRIEFYDSMKNIEKLEPRLFRAHKAYLVNPYRVSEINRMDHTLHFNKLGTCLISRRKIRELDRLLANS